MLILAIGMACAVQETQFLEEAQMTLRTIGSFLAVAGLLAGCSPSTDTSGGDSSTAEPEAVDMTELETASGDSEMSAADDGMTADDGGDMADGDAMMEGDDDPMMEGEGDAMADGDAETELTELDPATETESESQ